MLLQTFLGCLLRLVSSILEKFTSNHFKIILIPLILLFPERKDKIEHGNKLLVENFQSQLTNQLELLHKTVSSSVIQQENQLKEMEDDMQSFVSTKSEVLLLPHRSKNVILFNLSIFSVRSLFYTGHRRTSCSSRQT